MKKRTFNNLMHYLHIQSQINVCLCVNLINYFNFILVHLNVYQFKTNRKKNETNSKSGMPFKYMILKMVIEKLNNFCFVLFQMLHLSIWIIIVFLYSII